MIPENKVTGKILVIEDDSALAELLKATLELEGHQVILSANGKEGLEKISREQPDLVILDVILPGIDGWEVLFQIKENPVNSAVPVIMLTAKADSISKLFGLKHGAEDYITKPFEAPELAARVEVVLKRTLTKNMPECREKGLINRIPVEDGKKTLLLSINDIFYIQAKYNYAYVHTSGREFLSKFTLNELEDWLKNKLFARTHRSYIVNIHKIKAVVSLPKAEIILVLTDKEESKIPVSRARKEEIKRLLGL